MNRVVKECLTPDGCFDLLVPVTASAAEAFDLGWSAALAAQHVSNHYKLDVDFLRECARHFRNIPTNGEDAAHWANVYNAENCDRIASKLEATR